MRSRNRPPLWKRLLGVVFYTMFCAIVLMVGSLAGWIKKSPVMTQMVDQFIQPKDPADVFGNRQGITMLLLGTDYEYDVKSVTYDRNNNNKAIYNTVPTGRARADMIMVVRLDFASDKISGLSIPRDTYARLDGYRGRKINAYFKAGEKDQGPAMMEQAVEHVLPGINIDRTVVLNFDEFKEMVDLVGGVTLNVEKRMKYDDDFGGVHVDLYPGRQKLNGYDSMMYVRFRKGETGGDSDFARQDRQKNFMMAFRQSIMRDPLKLPQVMEKASTVMGNALTAQEIASLAYFAKGVKPTNIKMGQIPVVERRGTTDLFVNESELEGTLIEYNLLPYNKVSVR